MVMSVYERDRRCGSSMGWVAANSSGDDNDDDDDDVGCRILILATQVFEACPREDLPGWKDLLTSS